MSSSKTQNLQHWIKHPFVILLTRNAGPARSRQL